MERVWHEEIHAFRRRHDFTTASVTRPWERFSTALAHESVKTGFDDDSFATRKTRKTVVLQRTKVLFIRCPKCSCIISTSGTSTQICIHVLGHAMYPQSLRTSRQNQSRELSRLNLPSLNSFSLSLSLLQVSMLPERMQPLEHSVECSFVRRRCPQTIANCRCRCWCLLDAKRCQSRCSCCCCCYRKFVFGATTTTTTSCYSYYYSYYYYYCYRARMMMMTNVFA